MQAVLWRLGNLGPSVAVLLAAGGLVFGLYGWRTVRYLVVLDALLLALFFGVILDEMHNRAETVLLVRELTLVLAIGLSFLAWRYHRGAVAAVGGALWFFVPLCIFAGTGVPFLARVLIGTVGCGLAMAMHLTLHRQAAVVTTGVHGGWLFLAALIAASADPWSFGGQLLESLGRHAGVLPLIGMVFSAVLIALQWADFEREVHSYGNA